MIIGKIYLTLFGCTISHEAIFHSTIVLFITKVEYMVIIESIKKATLLHGLVDSLGL